ncbi:MAG: hypothetical protein EXS23_03330 [Pedosphaera sp.]|nr:hypothetical protein [Pedosphaera sp.]
MKHFSFPLKQYTGLRGVALLALCLIMVSSVPASPFTYQGRLRDGGVVPSTSQYDILFEVWDADAAGGKVSPVLNLAPVTTTNGVFTVILDFGPAVFNGAARWLQISVRANGSEQPYEVLSPRQAVTFTPQAIYALTVADGAVTPAKISGVLKTENIPSLDAGKITSGILADSLISGAIARSTDVSAATSEIVALKAQITVLSAAVAAISGTPEVTVLSGSTFVSADAADATLLASGLRNVVTIASPAWVNGAASDQPSARVGQSVVWTGQGMVVWGGTVAAGVYSSSGGAYRPDINAWTRVSTVSAPDARIGHSALWTGSRMIVWGGFSGTQYLNSGGQFSVANQTWSPVAQTGAPEARDSHVAIWTGSRMLVWGGLNFEGMLSDGGIYDPENNNWTTISLANPPAARAGASAVWATDRLLVWGGVGNEGFLNSGAQLRFTDGVPSAWQANSLVNAPTVRSKHTAVWTGSKMIIWGGLTLAGLLGDGASYDPATDSWTSLSSTNAPTARSSHAAVWTGSEMIVLGGETATGATATGGAYDPVLNKWRVLSNPGSPVARTEASAIWTGTEVVTFGGRNSGAYLSSLQRLTPQPAWYFYRKP